MTTDNEKIVLVTAFGFLAVFIVAIIIGNYLDDQVETSSTDIVTDSATSDLTDARITVHIDYSLKHKYIVNPDTNSNIDAVVREKTHVFTAHCNKDQLLMKLINDKGNEPSLQKNISDTLTGEGIKVNHVYVTEVSFR